LYIRRNPTRAFDKIGRIVIVYIAYSSFISIILYVLLTFGMRFLPFSCCNLGLVLFQVLALKGSYHGDTLGAMEAQAPSPCTGFLQQPW
jgi:hypothetical protein